MTRSKALVTVLILSTIVAGCSGFGGSGSGGHEVSVETVSVDGEKMKLIAISPTDGNQIDKGTTITVEAGYVTFTVTSTMNHDETIYLTYNPDRVKFDIATDTTRSEVRAGIGNQNFTVGAVKITARGNTERYELDRYWNDSDQRSAVVSLHSGPTTADLPNGDVGEQSFEALQT